jgi:hypothetical protein
MLTKVDDLVPDNDITIDGDENYENVERASGYDEQDEEEQEPREVEHNQYLDDATDEDSDVESENEDPMLSVILSELVTAEDIDSEAEESGIYHEI